jgi:hypothetical protein
MADDYESPPSRRTDVRKGAEMVCMEALAAVEDWPRFNSAHEAYAVLLEEVRELEAEVFRKTQDMEAMRREARQVGAMAVRFLAEIRVR